MFNVGGGELLVILLVALIVLGPQRLPDAARQVGRVMGDIRRISGGFQQELKDAFDASDTTPARRPESVPLAKAVADADDRPRSPAHEPRRDAGPPAAGRVRRRSTTPPTSPRRSPTPSTRSWPPSPPVRGPRPDSSDDTAPAAAEVAPAAPAPGTEPADGTDRLGDQRAAS